MISPQMGRQALQYAAWIILVSVFLLLFLDRGSAEFVITVISLVVGLVFFGTAWFLIRRSQR
jgi:heme O synthase-like polyprenyltransferase